MNNLNQDNSVFLIHNCSNNDYNRLLEDKFYIVPSEQERFIEILKVISSSDKPTVTYQKFNTIDSNSKPVRCSVGFICTEPHSSVIITFTPENTSESEEDTFDKLTGLYSFDTFVRMLDKNTKSGRRLMIVYLDILRFKTVNDMFGMESGDELLYHVAEVIRSGVNESGAGCRIGSDRFVFYMDCPVSSLDFFIEEFLEKISRFDLAFEIVCNAGIYITKDDKLSAESIIDRAIMAQSSIKGSYTTRYCYYSEAIRNQLLTEQEITGMMRTAIKEEQFVIHYQPQYNHTTGMLVGAEALVRWLHPEKGLISPGMFIPVFEKNGFITKLDLYVFERVCKFIQKCIQNRLMIVPISINLTRYDIFSPNFINKLEYIRKNYDVPPKYIRVEITESAALGNSEFINEAVKKLHSFGYIVEMDDFGSGYSSLNILKDIDFDIIKLDMKFLERENGDGSKGGTILSSIVRMVNWLGLPIIAEGVETVKQADFLRSIGCDYIQGYLYSKPLPEKDYERIISGSIIGSAIPQMKLIETLDSGKFWSNDSLETLIFSNFVGGAAIFEYKDDKIEVLRVNKKYLSELGMNLTEKDVISNNPLDFMSEMEQQVYIDMLKNAIQTEEEQECETWRTIKSECCGEERFCIRSNVRMIGRSREAHLFYAMIRNVTGEKKYVSDILDSERRFKMASEQINIYYWEYTVATREMRPCFRCMRDLGLPALLTNYPDSAIDMGIFPPDYADMYRDWHKQIAEGVPELEAVIPLTVARVPFVVRYTTEFDENGRPIKAYGSAALVVE